MRFRNSSFYTSAREGRIGGNEALRCDLRAQTLILDEFLKRIRKLHGGIGLDHENASFSGDLGDSTHFRSDHGIPQAIASILTLSKGSWKIDGQHRISADRYSFEILV